LEADGIQYLEEVSAEQRQQYWSLAHATTMNFLSPSEESHPAPLLTQKQSESLASLKKSVAGINAKGITWAHLKVQQLVLTFNEARLDRIARNDLPHQSAKRCRLFNFLPDVGYKAPYVHFGADTFHTFAQGLVCCCFSYLYFNLFLFKLVVIVTLFTFESIGLTSTIQKV
jgi:hypothetical protein